MGNCLVDHRAIALSNEIASRALIGACCEGNTDRALELLDNFQCDVSGESWEFTLFQWAAEHGSTAMMEALLRHGADMHYISSHNIRRESALHRAGGALKNSGEAVNFILSRGETPFVYTSDGETPLHYAVSVDAATALVEYSYRQACKGKTFDPSMVLSFLNHQNKFGETALRGHRLYLNEFRRLPNRRAVVEQVFGSRENVIEYLNSLIGRMDVVDYLASWKNTQLAISSRSENVADSVSVMQNPKLSEMQMFLSSNLHSVIEQSAVAEVSFAIMGYLSPQDLLNRWDMWLY